jgi:hypothetical protein
MGWHVDRGGCTMSNAVIIECRSQTAGIAVREEEGYRFYACQSLFQDIDDKEFQDIRDVRNAVAQLMGQAGRPAQAVPGSACGRKRVENGPRPKTSEALPSHPRRARPIQVGLVAPGGGEPC